MRVNLLAAPKSDQSPPGRDSRQAHHAEPKKTAEFNPSRTSRTREQHPHTHGDERGRGAYLRCAGWLAGCGCVRGCLRLGGGKVRGGCLVPLLPPSLVVSMPRKPRGT